MKPVAVLFGCLFLSLINANTAHAQKMVTFSYPDTVDYWTVPAGVDSIQVDVVGAPGMSFINKVSGYIYGSGGNGGEVQATLAVTAGQVLRITLGKTGSVGGGKGYNGGGGGSSDLYGNSGGGGGATDIRIGGSDLTNRVIVAGGGGGAACDYANYSIDYNGGDAGYPNGGMGHSNGAIGPGGGGGTQLAGGYGGTHGTDSVGTPGGLGFGGSAPKAGGSKIAGGGGGGGYYGGGGGTYGGGGGGSSYADAAIATNVHYSSYYSTSFVTITYGFESLAAAHITAPIQMACILPNPSVTNAQLQLILAENAEVGVSITSMTGRKVWSHNIQGVKGKQSITLPPTLSEGLYIVHLTANDHKYDKVLKWEKN